MVAKNLHLEPQTMAERANLENSKPIPSDIHPFEVHLLILPRYFHKLESIQIHGPIANEAILIQTSRGTHLKDMNNRTFAILVYLPWIQEISLYYLWLSYILCHNNLVLSFGICECNSVPWDSSQVFDVFIGNTREWLSLNRRKLSLKWQLKDVGHSLQHSYHLKNGVSGHWFYS